MTLGRDPHHLAAMDLYTRTVSRGDAPPPPGVLLTFTAVPEPPCGACDHRNHPGTECGMSLGDGTLCWCGTPAPALGAV